MWRYPVLLAFREGPAWMAVAKHRVGGQLAVVEFRAAAWRVAGELLEERQVEFVRDQAGQRGLRFAFGHLDPKGRMRSGQVR